MRESADLSKILSDFGFYSPAFSLINTVKAVQRPVLFEAYLKLSDRGINLHCNKRNYPTGFPAFGNTDNSQ